MNDLDPAPIGWFAIALSRELKPGSSKRGILATAPYSVRRSTHGELTCAGSATALCERGGFVFAWHHPRGESPSFELPHLPEDGFTKPRFSLIHANSHPQETYENSIDLAHFPTVHGYTDIKVLMPMQLQDHRMSAGYEIARGVPFVNSPRKLRSQFQVNLHGIGFAHNQVHVPALGLNVRMLALSTPTVAGEVELRLGVSVQTEGLNWATKLALPAIVRGITHTIVDDFKQDLAVWNHKVYLRPPVLSSVDGPIGNFRKRCKQFYNTSHQSRELRIA